MELRIGNGFDIHRFQTEPTPGRELILGGVRFAGETALEGHSDADVIAHAVAEAILGAAGLGDLGSHFPDTDPDFADANSLDLLAQVVAEASEQGWEISNVDCSVVAERPKLAPVREQMQSRLSKCVGAPVSVKGRRAEGIGGLGRSEGIACFASALLSRESAPRSS